ncbi:MAG TPA: transposase [Terriglobales bacterium]|nr:transposase [Terriglobales bacterium]
MSDRPTVLAALRRFLPEFLQTGPPLSTQQRRAIWAITHCRTAALGGKAFACKPCKQVHFAYHSCNHKACPQCGALATHHWVHRELAKLINAPYFLVTFTLPAELRGCFFGPHAKQAYDLFFTAVMRALSEKLAADKALRAAISGFTAVLHTWNQRLEFHPHIHCLVPGAGLDAKGQYVQVKKPDFLVFLPHLQKAFRQHFYRLLKEQEWQVDPAVWGKDWGVHIQPAGSGAPAVKYLGTYVARTAINDARLLALTDDSVTFRWKDRSDKNRTKTMTLPGIGFVRRYLRHVLPRGLRAIRYYGFCHPTATANRLRVQLHSGKMVDFAPPTPEERPAPACSSPLCPKCRQPMQLILSLSPWQKSRGPPVRPP